MFPRLRIAWRALRRRSAWERDLEEELRSHVEHRAEDLARAGLPRAEAERRARMELGAREAYKEQCREAHGLRWPDEFRQDLRYAIRSLRRNPAFTAVAVLSLALGIGVNAAVFGLLDAVFWRPLPVRKPQELVAIYTLSRAGGTPAFRPSSYADFEDIRKGATVLAHSAAFGRAPVRLRFAQDAERVSAELVTGEYFDVVGIAPAIGRLLATADDRPGAEPVAVISDSLWQRRFGRDPKILGKPIRLEGAVFPIVGVAPKRFHGTVLDWGDPPDVWVSMAQYRLAVLSFRHFDMLYRRDIPWLLMIGRMGPDVRLEQVEAAADVIGNRLAREYPRTNATQSFRVLSINEGRFWPGHRQQSVQFASLLSCIALAVLLISCFNVSSMLIAKTLAQVKEISLRLAIGAGALRIARERLADSLTLAAMGCVASIPVSVLLTSVLRWFPLPFLVPIAVNLGVDWRVTGFTAAISLLVAFVAGIAPALNACKTDIAGTLKGVGNVQRRGLLPGSLRHGIIVAQVAVSFVLLIGAGLLSRSLVALERTDTGYRPAGVVVAELEVGDVTADAGNRIYRGVLSRVTTLPGVESAGFSSEILPTLMYSMQLVRLPRAFDSAGAEPIAMDSNVVSPGYFETVRMPLAAGRAFQPQDDTSRAPVVIVNQAAARRLWGSEEAVGKRLRITGESADREVVGVVRDAKYHELFETPAPFLFRPLAQTFRQEVNLHVRGSADVSALAQFLRRELAAENEIAVIHVQSLDSYIAGRLSQPRMAALLATAVALIGLILSAAGLHSIIAYFVAQQRREIGIRIAVGARASDILKLVAGRGLALVVTGLAIGAALATWSMQLIRSQLHGVGSWDPAVYLVATSAFVAVAAMASIGPALKAVGIHPSLLLRTQ